MDGRRDALRLAAGGAVILVGLLHLFHRDLGFPRLVELVRIGDPVLQPRPLAFTVSGIVIVVGVLAVWNGYLPRREAYLAGLVAMATYLAGYVLWHLTGQGGWWPGLEPHGHAGHPLVVMWEHYRGDRWAQASTILEVLTAVLLGYLYRREGHTDAS